MNEQQAKWVRIGELALLGLAGLLTVYMAVTLVSRLSQHGDFNELLARYEPVVEEAADAEAPADAEPSDQTDQSPNKEPADGQNKDAAKDADKNTNENESKNEDESKDGNPNKDGPPDKAAGNNDEKPAEPKPDPLEAQVKRIAARNIFSPPKEPPKFTGKLVGMLGDEAIFQGNKYAKVGQDIMGAKVKAMGPDWVEVEFDGKTIKQWVFGPRKEGGIPAPPPNPDLSVDVPPDLLERFKGLAEDKQAEITEKLPEEMRQRLQRAL